MVVTEAEEKIRFVVTMFRILAWPLAVLFVPFAIFAFPLMLYYAMFIAFPLSTIAAVFFASRLENYYDEYCRQQA